jgi:predicted ArsR family transcriptional regulator
MMDTRTPDLFADYPDAPGHKGGDTSRGAAQAIAPRVARLQTRIIAALNRRGPMTPDETAAVIGESVLAVRPRFSELARHGVIEKTGARHANESGMSASVWRVAQKNESGAP